MLGGSLRVIQGGLADKLEGPPNIKYMQDGCSRLERALYIVC
jgi:hypothetical protein